MFIKRIFLLMVAILLSACALKPVPDLEVSQPWVKNATLSEISAGDLNSSCVCDVNLGATTSLAYMTIKNLGGAADALVKAESSVAGRIEFRKSGASEDLTALTPLDSIEIPAGQEISFASGQYVMLLMGLKQDLKPGEKVQLSLFFEKSGEIEVEVEVRLQ